MSEKQMSLPNSPLKGEEY